MPFSCWGQTPLTITEKGCVMDFTCPHCDQTTPQTIEKYCPKCETTLPHPAFYMNKAQPSGLHSWCKECVKANNKTPEQREKNNVRMRGWNSRNREKINANAMEAYWELQERRQTDPELDAHLRSLSRARSRRAYTRDP